MPKECEQRVFEAFYSTPRAGAGMLSDGGGPFGFDIHFALIVDCLVDAFEVDAIIETGVCTGDTTDYLSMAYPALPVVGIEIDSNLAGFAQQRLRSRPNVTVIHGDSAAFLPGCAGRYAMPLIYLDAHWGKQWPLPDELESLDRAIVIVDDYDIGHPRFAYDEYDGVRCDQHLLRQYLPVTRIFVPDPTHQHAFPCLQVGRRAGRAIFAVGVDDSALTAFPALQEQVLEVSS